MYPSRYTELRCSESELQAVSKQAFSKSVAKLATRFAWRALRRSTRGYLVTLLRLSRVRQTNTSLDEAIQCFTESTYIHLSWSRTFINQQKGYGAVTRRMIPTGTVVAEYLGEEVHKEVAAEREKQYAATGRLCTMINLSGMDIHN